MPARFMIRPFARCVAAMLALSLPCAGLQAQQTPASERSEPYVNVTFEVNGLDESAALLNDAARELSATLREVAASPDELTPEQLAAFTELVERTNVLVETLDRTVQGIGPAIRGAEAPARDVLTGLLETTRTQAIDPTLRSIDRRAKTWLALSLLGALLVVGAAGFGLYVATRQLRAMAAVLKSIGDDYVIVPRQPPVSPATGDAAVPADRAESPDAGRPE